MIQRTYVHNLLQNLLVTNVDNTSSRAVVIRALGVKYLLILKVKKGKIKPFYRPNLQGSRI